MNKIFVSRNKIISDSSNVLIENNLIRLLNSDVYSLEYIDIDDINICIIVDNGVCAKLYESSFLKDIKVNNKYIILDGELIVNKFYNNDNVEEVINIDLCSYGSKIDYKFSNICSGKESYVINIEHNNMNTISNISNKSIAILDSNLDFIINSRVSKENVKSVLNQDTRIVNFGNSNSNIRPNMFIDCDDISARHGSVIGTFKTDLVFYLMSRGIDYNDSIKLLVKGYLFSNIDLDSYLREKIINVIDMYWR